MDFAHQIDNAVQSHQAWKTRLKLAIKTGRTDLTTDEVARDSICAFGRWIRNLPAEERSPEFYSAVREAHSRFHRVAAGIVELVHEGDVFAAHGRLAPAGEFERISVELMTLLAAWRDEAQERLAA